MNWETYINSESKKDYYKKIMEFIDEEYQNKSILPPYDLIYNALNKTPLDQVKIVLIGQDPYQTKEFAMGLSFSVPNGISIPKSLMNIFKELHNELDIEIPTSGNLEYLASRGVLLLNTILTVEEGKPLSHKNKGWEEFTKGIINLIEQEDRKIVYLLLGNEARKIKDYITNPLHLVLETSHPSPLGAYKGFFGSNIFIKCNEYLNLDKSFWVNDEQQK